MNKNLYISSLLQIFAILFLVTNICSISAAEHISQHFVQCLSQYSDPNQSSSISSIIYTPTNSTYESILRNSIQNLRFSSASTPKPDIIITPFNESQIPPVIYCAKHHGMQIRIRSGGHDFEGLSSTSKVPFLILDMGNFRSINIDIKRRTAWAQAGATVGELCHAIANASSTLGYPLGVWSTIGLGGHISGGGYGTLKRKYGLGSDNVVDARLVDVNGNILDRKTMGEDLFWAIRGGGSASFGVIIAWKLNLVYVPKTVTVFTVRRTLEQNATNIFNRWQSIAYRLPKDLYIRAQIRTNATGTLTVGFGSMFLGKIDVLIPLMNKRFPELGLKNSDCTEMSWIESVVHFSSFPTGTSPDILLNRSASPKFYFKSKSDFVTKAISRKGILGLFKVFLEVDPTMASLVMSPSGGRMSEISDNETLYPHRRGTMYMIYQQVFWGGGSNATVIQERMNWIRKLSDYLTPYVSKNPRRAYLNYNDLDLGVNQKNSQVQENTFGPRYFNKNFARLVKIKGKVDPDNFFQHEQSIPLP